MNTTFAAAGGWNQLNMTINTTSGTQAISSTVNFTVDITPPQLSLVLPKNATYFATNVSLNFSSSDPNLGQCNMELDSTNTSIASCNNSTFTAASGHHRIKLYSNDSGGNTNVTELIDFEVDSTAPSIAMNLPLNATYTSPVTFNFNRTDPNIDACNAEIDGVNYSVAGCKDLLIMNGMEAWNLYSDLYIAYSLNGSSFTSIQTAGNIAAAPNPIYTGRSGNHVVDSDLMSYRGQYYLVYHQRFLNTKGGSSFGTDGSGLIVWQNTANAASSNDAYTTAVGLKTTSYSDNLIAKGFGFSIPSTATIKGIVVNIEKKCSTSLKCKDYNVQLTKDGSTPEGDNKASGTAYGNNDATETYGNSTDLWSLALTPAAVSSANFGVFFASYGTDTTSRTASVDYISMQIYYSDSAGKLTIANSTDLFHWSDLTDVQVGNASDANAQTDGFLNDPSWFVDSTGSPHIITSILLKNYTEVHPLNNSPDTWGASGNWSDYYYIQDEASKIVGGIDPYVVFNGTSYLMIDSEYPSGYGRLRTSTSLTSNWTTGTNLSSSLGSFEQPSILQNGNNMTLYFAKRPINQQYIQSTDYTLSSWAATKTNLSFTNMNFASGYGMGWGKVHRFNITDTRIINQTFALSVGHHAIKFYANDTGGNTNVTQAVDFEVSA